MSIEERARYFIGEAIMRRITKSERDPATISDIRDVCNWIETWLTPDELDAVTDGTGLIFDEELARKLQGNIEPSEGGDDDIPF